MIKLLENVNLFLSMASAVSISGAANCGILRQLLFEDPGKQSFVLACNEYACNDQYIQPAAKPVTENQIVVRRRAELLPISMKQQERTEAPALSVPSGETRPKFTVRLSSCPSSWRLRDLGTIRINSSVYQGRKCVPYRPRST